MATILSITFNGTTTNYTTTLTRASGTTGTGYDLDVGFGSPYGSLADDQFYMVTQCRAVYTSAPGTLFVRFQGAHLQTFFTSIETSLGTFLTASATTFGGQQVGGGSTLWGWSGAGNFPSSGTEIIQINP